jgi:SAM-dependent methyltransferase
MSIEDIRRRVIPDVGFHQNHYATALAALVPAGCRWLDLGAGAQLHDGFGVPTSAELGQRARQLIGADPVVTHLAQNRALSAAVGASGDALPFADGAFDIVSANMVLEHLEDPARVFGEVARILMPGGRFIFVTPNRNHPGIRMASLLLSARARRRAAIRVETRDPRHVFPTFYRANTVRTVASLAARTGFRRAELRVLRNIPFLRAPAPAVWLECQFIRATGWGPLQGLGADLLGVLER